MLFNNVQTITINGMVITHINDNGLESVKFIENVNGDSVDIEEWFTNYEMEMRPSLKY